MTRHLRTLARTLALLGILAAPWAVADDTHFEFALIGDTPYSQSERAALPQLLDKLGKENLAFVIHDGDFKDGGSMCSDALFEDRLTLFNRSPHPFVFVPGDNEWTDCHRTSNGSYDPVERLNKLRAMFFAKPETLGQQTFPVKNQTVVQPEFADYREHLRWVHGSVLFVTLNVPGSGNNIGKGPEPSAEFRARGRAVSAWVENSFALARDKGLRGIVLVMQADPDFTGFAAGKPSRGYKDLLNQLRQETTRFPGQVMLVHGDSHQITIDKPLRHATTGAVLGNFTRVETFGYPFRGWVRVRVAENEPDLFKIEALSAP